MWIRVSRCFGTLCLGNGSHVEFFPGGLRFLASDMPVEPANLVTGHNFVNFAIILQNCVRRQVNGQLARKKFHRLLCLPPTLAPALLSAYEC